MNSLIKDTVRPSLIKRNIPPLYKDLLIWTNREHDPTTHTIKSRISDYDVTLKQGLVAKTGGAGTDKVTFTGFELTKATSFELSIDIHDMGEQSGAIGNVQTIWSTASATQYIGLREVAGGLVFYDGVDALLFVGFTNIPTGAYFNVSFTKPANSNTVTCTIYNYVTGTTESKDDTTAGDFTAFTVARLGSRGNGDRPLRSGFSNEQITVNGTCVAYRPYCGDTKDICPSGNHGTITGTVSLAERSDYSTFRNDEYGFAVKTGAIYPKLLSGTGYAGLVGDPDATYHGLIALKGQIEIAGQALLGTLFDFTHDPNTEIDGAGISWDDWDNTDCNDDSVGTAETNLDTDYYSALTASLMTCEALIYGGTSNVAQRVFFRVANKVMKADGSFLASGGIVTDILVYKRDLSPDERLRVMKWCRTFPFTSVNLIGDGTDIFGADSEYFYDCLV